MPKLSDLFAMVRQTNWDDFALGGMAILFLNDVAELIWAVPTNYANGALVSGLALLCILATKLLRRRKSNA